jgi:hypothetical protein
MGSSVKAKNSPQFLMATRGLMPLHGDTHHLVVHIDVALRGREMPVISQHHDRLGRDPGMCETGDEPAPAAMA